MIEASWSQGIPGPGYKRPVKYAVHGLCAGLWCTPWRQLRAGLEVLLLEDAGTKILYLRGQPCRVKGRRPSGGGASGRVSSWLLEAPFFFEGAEHENSCGWCAMQQGFLGVG